MCHVPMCYGVSKRTANVYVAALTQHKRLRENSWKLPPMSYLHAFQPPPPQPSTPTDAHTLEFDQFWETTSDLNEDDFEYMREESTRWWGSAPSSVPTR